MTANITELLDQMQARAEVNRGDSPGPINEAGLYNAWIEHQIKLVDDIQPDALKAYAALREVLELHRHKLKHPLGSDVFSGEWCATCQRSYPCETLQAITKHLQGGDDAT